jgi:hypothetical protein
MAEATISRTISKTETDYARQAYQILHLGFTAAPILFGLDKFLNLMTDWSNYLAPWMVRIVGNAHNFMYLIGTIEIAAGILVWFKPRWGAYVVALWILGIIGNLLTYPGFFDVALRDFGLFLGALALGRLSEVYQKA